MQHFYLSWVGFFLLFQTLTLSKSRTGAFHFKGCDVCSLYSCPLSSYTPCSYRQGGEKNIPVSNKSEIHQGPQSLRSASSAQLVLQAAAQQAHFVPCAAGPGAALPLPGWELRPGGFSLPVLKILNKGKSCTIDFRARRGGNCATTAVSEQNFNAVEGLFKLV